MVNLGDDRMRNNKCKHAQENEIVQNQTIKSCV